MATRKLKVARLDTQAEVCSEDRHGPDRPSPSVFTKLWKKLLIPISVAAAGLASFSASLDAIGSFVAKVAPSLGKVEPRLPRVLSQSDEDCVRADLACQIDLWLENPHDQPLYVTALSLTVLAVDSAPILGRIQPSGDPYRVDLTGLSRVGMTRKMPLYQRIDPHQSDRFVILLGAKDLHDRFRSWKLKAQLETSEGALPLKSLSIKLPWDDQYSAGPPVAVPSFPSVQ